MAFFVVFLNHFSDEQFIYWLDNNGSVSDVVVVTCTVPCFCTAAASGFLFQNSPTWRRTDCTKFISTWWRSDQNSNSQIRYCTANFNTDLFWSLLFLIILRKPITECIISVSCSFKIISLDISQQNASRIGCWCILSVVFSFCLPFSRWDLFCQPAPEMPKQWSVLKPLAPFGKICSVCSSYLTHCQPADARRIIPFTSAVQCQYTTVSCSEYCTCIHITCSCCNSPWYLCWKGTLNNN